MQFYKAKLCQSAFGTTFLPLGCNSVREKVVRGPSAVQERLGQYGLSLVECPKALIWYCFGMLAKGTHSSALLQRSLSTCSVQCMVGFGYFVINLLRIVQCLHPEPWEQVRAVFVMRADFFATLSTYTTLTLQKWREKLMELTHYLTCLSEYQTSPVG